MNPLRNLRKAAPLLVMTLCLPACGGLGFAMDTPPGFTRYRASDDFRLITADGVRLKGRKVENKPVAELGFWKDALREHLEKRGYTHRDTQCFQTARGLDGCTLEFVLPSGAEDWVQSETLFVRGDEVLLVEAAAPFEAYEARRAGIQTALRTFDPGS